jgi:tetratricopeptide (TPR) repeat protein
LNVPKVVWVALAIFEVAFGIAIFMVTRSYYKDQDQSVPPAVFGAQSLSLTGSGVGLAPPIDIEQPRTPEELALLADSHFSNRQYEAAAALYEQLLTQDRTNVDLLNNLALTLHYTGRADEALRRIEEGVAADPNHQRIRLTQGFVLSQVGRSAEAVSALNLAIELNGASEIADSARRMLSDIATSEQ